MDIDSRNAGREIISKQVYVHVHNLRSHTQVLSVYMSSNDNYVHSTTVIFVGDQKPVHTGHHCFKCTL